MKTKSILEVFLAAFVAKLGRRVRMKKKPLWTAGHHPHQGAQERKRRGTPGTAAYLGGGGRGGRG